MATGAVSRRVQAAFRAHVGLVAAESLLVGGSAGFATVAASLSPTPTASTVEGQRLAIAVLVAALAAIAWMLERLGDASSVARTLDRQRALHGAVLTAFQSERADESSAVAKLLASRTSREVSPLSFLRASLRASAPLLALPWFAIALWSLAADRAGAERGKPSVAGSTPAAVTAGLRGRVEAIRDAADRIARTPGLAPDLAEVCRRIADEAARLASPPPETTTARADGELRDLERRLDLARNAIPLEAVTSGDSRGRMRDPDPGIEALPAGPMREPHPPSRTASPAIESGEHGVLASRWWAPRYDAVVDRWLAMRRQLPENQRR